MTAPVEMLEAKAKLAHEEHLKLTVRKLLDWYGRYRRRAGLVDEIRKDLEAEGLVTMPDFEGLHIDAPMYLYLKAQAPAVRQNGAQTESPLAAQGDRRSPGESAEAESTSAAEVDPSHRISRLEASTNVPVTVSPSDSVEKATTIMLANEFSQLPVMTNDRDVKGMISWRSIGPRRALGAKCESVQHCLEAHHEVLDTASMLDAVREVAT